MKTKPKSTIASRARAAGLPAQTVYNRLFHGWSEKKALSVPVRKKAKPRFQLKGLTTKPPKKTVAYKVEAKKKQTSGSRVKIPMEGVEKFEYPKDNMLVYVVVVAVIVVIVAMMAT